MSAGKCFHIGGCLVYSRLRTRRRLFSLHHSTFGVRYSAVLFRSYRLWQPNDLSHTANR